MGSHKADSLQSFNLLNLLKKLCKCHRLFQILSIRVYILTKEHNFYHIICHKSFNLANDIFWITASLTSTHIRYDTVAAEIVTSEHDVNTGFEGKFTFARKILHNLIGILPDIDHHSLRFKSCHDQFCKFINIVSSKDQVNKPIALLDLLYNSRFLHHTSAESDEHMRILFLLCTKLSQTSVNTQIRIFTDSTGVVDNEVCFLFIRLFLVSDQFQNTYQLFGVTSVHLTTESRHAKSQISSDLLCFFAYILPRFGNVIVLSLRLSDRSFFGKIYCIKINIIHMLLTSLYKLVQLCIIFIINGCQFLCQFFFLNLHLLAKSIQICIKIP